jgi:drug/metabolite transporter (DMT)-like permease
VRADRESRGPDLAGAGLIVVAAACFGTLGPLSRFAGDAEVQSLTLVTWRAGLGALVVASFIVVARGVGRVRLVAFQDLPARDRWFMLAAAVANTVLNFAAFVAFERITIAMTLLVFYLYPAMVAIASVVWFGERLDRLRWAALGTSLVGTVLVMAGAGELGRVDALGVGLAFLAGLMQTFYVLAARHGFAHVPGAQAAALSMGGATVLYLAIAVLVGTFGALAQPLASTAALVPVLLAGVVGAGIPTLCFILGIRRLGPARAAILATLEPIVGVGLAAWLIGEPATPLQLAGGALILAAAVLLQVRPSAAAGEHEAIADREGVAAG